MLSYAEFVKMLGMLLQRDVNKVFPKAIPESTEV